MKKRLAAWLLILCCCLGGCASLPPESAADGNAWDDAWVTVGNIVGVDTPEAMTPQENNDALSANGMFYATWSIGDAVPYTNEDGEDAQVYDAQVYLLLAGYDAADKAEDRSDEWLSMASGQYAVEDTFAQTCNGQDFTVITYTYTSATNPYARGASAFGVYRNYAVSAEIACREGFEGDARAILTDFLERCHYAV